MAFLAGLSACIFIDASFGVYLYQLQYFVNPADRWWHYHLPDIRYSFIAAIAILIAYVVRSNRYSSNRLSHLPQVKWIVAFTVLMFLVGFIAVWPEMHWKTFTNFVKLAVFIFVTYKVIDRPQKFERMMGAFLLGSFYLGYLAHSTGRNDFGRLEGIGPADATDSNTAAAVLITSIPILIFYLFKGKNWQRAVCLVMLAYIMDAIILYSSRGAFIGLVASAVYMLAFVMKKSDFGFKRKLSVLAVTLVCTGLFLSLTDTSFRERMLTLNEIQTSSEYGMEGAGSSRVYFWRKAIDLAREHPFGVGVWGYQFLSHEFLPSEMLTGGRRAEHSTYFEALSEYGYLGCFIFIGLLISNFKITGKVRKHPDIQQNEYLYFQSVAISSGFVGFLVAAVFINALYAEILYWFISFFACFANIYVYKGFARNAGHSSD